MSQTQAQAEIQALLDQYAQDAGFANLQDLKNNYQPNAYNAVINSMVTRALIEQGLTEQQVKIFWGFKTV